MSFKKTQNILKVEEKEGEKGNYAEIVVEGGKYPEKVFKPAANYLDGPGTYEIEREKRGQYWNIVKLKKVDGSVSSPAAKSGNGFDKESYQLMKRLETRSISAQVAIKGGVELAVALKDCFAEKGIVKPESVLDFAALAARTLFNEIARSVKGNDKPATNTPPATDEPAESVEDPASEEAPY